MVVYLLEVSSDAPDRGHQTRARQFHPQDPQVEISEAFINLYSGVGRGRIHTLLGFVVVMTMV